MRRWFPALVLLLCASAMPAAGEPSQPASHWLEVQTAHFSVLTDSNEKQARHIASQFEQMRAVFHVLMPNVTDDTGMPIIVLALKDRQSFQALEPEAYLASNQLDLAGLFLRAPDKIFILLRLDAEGEHPFATVYHEYTHLMLNRATWLPLWLNEGLAEFYQNTDIHEKVVLLGQPSARDILFLRQQRMLPLTTLLSVDHASPYYHDEHKGSVFYAEAWALTHYIEFTDREKNTHHLEEYSRRLMQHEDSVTAAQQVFGDLKQLEKALNHYVEQSSFKMFKLSMPMAVDDSSFTARTISRPQAEALRADVLVDNNRLAEAQVLLDHALHEEPGNELAHEVMGSLKFRQSDLPAARKWYGEAVALDSHSYLAHYYYAVMSLQAGDKDHDAAIETSLERAIDLNPDFAAADDTLAMFYNARRMKLVEAHMLNVKAVTLEPSNLNYRIDTAEVLANQGDFENAILVLKRAGSLAKTPAESTSIQNRIDRIEAHRAAFEKAH